MGVLGGMPSTASIALNFVRSRAPLATDDASSGYAVGSFWTNTVTGQTYLCMNVAAGQAVWTEVIVQVPPPTGGGLLTWSPPGYPSYSGYQQRTISNAARNHTVAEGSNIDAIFTFSEVITAGEVQIQGFRNAVIIGGEILRNAAVAGGNTTGMKIYRCGGTAGGGIVHIEGLKIHGTNQTMNDTLVLSTGRTLASGTNGAVLQVQNCYFKNTWYDSNAHGDNMQLWTIGTGWPAGYAGGVGKVRIDRFTGYTVQQGIYFWNLDGALEDVDIRNTNLEGYGAQTGQIGPNKGKRADLYGRQSTATYTNVYTYDTATAQLGIQDHFIPNQNGTYYGGTPDLTRRNILNTDAQGPYVTWVAGSDIFGSVRWGRPPGGDFCPSTTPGINYVSPLYQ